MQEILTYGGKEPDARTVLVYGNCQAPFLAHMLSGLDDLNGDYRFVFAPNHAMPGEQQAAAIPEIHLRDVALLLLQHEDSPNPASAALRGRLPADCPVVRYPTFLMNCLWPFECPEPRGGAEPGFPWKRYPHGDMIGLQIAQSGLTGSLAVAAYLDLSLRKMPDLQVRLQRDLDRMRHYDAHCDVKLADYVQENFREQHLFWTYGHVSEAGVAELALRVADAARPVLGGTAQRARQRVEMAMGFGGMGGLQVPIHPIVADALGLRFWEADRHYRWYSQEWTFYDYIARYIGYEPW